MCTFMNTLKRGGNSSSGKSNKQRIFLSIKPTSDPKSFYRFRILNFTSPKKSDRTTSFIERFTHTVWGKNESGKPVIESQVICPATNYVKNLTKRDCPICKLAEMNFAAYKESGYRDRESLKKSRELGRKFEYLVPVWVLNDPNYEGNNNKMKVFSFDRNHKIFDPEKQEYVPAYEYFQKVINLEIEKSKRLEREGKPGYNWCNSENAVDICIRMERVPKVANEGTPREAHWEENEFKMIKFSNKPYTIPSITKENIDNFEFDDQYYVSSTLDELNDYYNRFCKVQNDDVDIPDEEDLGGNVSSRSSIPAKKNSSDDIDLQNDSLTDDSEDEDKIGEFEKLLENGEEVEKPVSKKKIPVKKIVEEEVVEEEIVEKKSPPKKKVEEKKIEEEDENGLPDDLDSFLDGLDIDD